MRIRTISNGRNLRKSSLKIAALLAVALVSISGQVGLRLYITPSASLAGANALSAAIGLSHGQGMTISSSEGIAIKTKIDSGTDANDVYHPGGDRMPLLEPLPGLVVVYFLWGFLGLPLSFNALWVLNVALIVAATLALADELMNRRLALGLVAGLAVAAFVPVHRVSVIIGYDPFEFAILVAAVVSLLRFSRTGDRKWLLINGICLGLGLWIRSYFVLYVAAQTVVALLLVRRKSLPWTSMIRWTIPVLLLGAIMVGVRDSGSTGARLTRGAFWHTFWAGVGQFENDEIEGFTDWDVCQLAVGLGFDSPCDPTYTDPDQIYLFQYGAEYNRLLEEEARKWLPENTGRVVRNTAARLFWLAVPGAMSSSRIERQESGRAVAVIISIAILGLAVLAVLRLRRSFADELLIFVGTYAALIPLAAFYFIAKVVMISYFCVLVVACAGALSLSGK